MQNKYLFDIVTDLKRSAMCLLNGNKVSSKSFLKHINTIPHQHAQDVLGFSIEKYLNNLDKYSLNNYQQAEKLLTLSSIIFSRAINSLSASSSR